MNVCMHWASVELGAFSAFRSWDRILDCDTDDL